MQEIKQKAIDALTKSIQESNFHSQQELMEIMEYTTDKVVNANSLEEIQGVFSGLQESLKEKGMENQDFLESLKSQLMISEATDLSSLINF